MNKEFEKLFKICKRKGINDAELSRISGVPKSAISRIKNGTLNPSFETINKLATALGYRLIVKIKK